jgi:hypothetical protein
MIEASKNNAMRDSRPVVAPVRGSSGDELDLSGR